MRKLIPLLALPAFVACATTPPPVDQIAAARAMVGQAQPAAIQDAPLPLSNAQAKLANAERAMQQGHYDEARRFAEQAQVDAKFALAMAENARAQRSAAEVDSSIEALRSELRRQAQ